MAFSLDSSLFWGVEYDRPSQNPFCYSEETFFFLLVCELFRAHEMCRRFEVTEMLECKVLNLSSNGRPT